MDGLYIYHILVQLILILFYPIIFQFFLKQSDLFYISTKNTEINITAGDDRSFWIYSLLRIAKPVLLCMSKGNLQATLTQLINKTYSTSAFEALARTLNGISPFLEIHDDNTKESSIRSELLTLSHQALIQAVNRSSADNVFQCIGHQPLVEFAFLSQAFLRSPTRLWGELDKQTKSSWISLMKSSRKIKPYNNNWLLFPGEVEAFLYQETGEYDVERLYLGTNAFMDGWYKGDGVYGDGPEFHFDYYNSYVIHPMLLDILSTQMKIFPNKTKTNYKNEKLRAISFAGWLERIIMPDGSFPVFGRSSSYRMGVFHQLANAALRNDIIKHAPPGQIRAALTAVIRKIVNDYNITPDGWLKLGLIGDQIGICENYINYGSLYLCNFIFLPLGLPQNSHFWSDPPIPWTSKKAWNGLPFTTH